MGIEAINFVYLPDSSRASNLIETFRKFPEIEDFSEGESGQYRLRKPNYLIDFLTKNEGISIRIALGCSEKSVEHLFIIFKNISELHGGILKVIEPKILITNFNTETCEELKNAFRERQRFFQENIADVSDLPLTSSDLFKYIREHGIKPRGHAT